jgi:hypothetical protein
MELTGGLPGPLQRSCPAVDGTNAASHRHRPRKNQAASSEDRSRRRGYRPDRAFRQRRTGSSRLRSMGDPDGSHRPITGPCSPGRWSFGLQLRMKRSLLRLHSFNQFVYAIDSSAVRDARREPPIMVDLFVEFDASLAHQLITARGLICFNAADAPEHIYRGLHQPDFAQR